MPLSNSRKGIKLTTVAFTSVAGIENQQGYAYNVKIATKHIPYEPFPLYYILRGLFHKNGTSGTERTLFGNEAPQKHPLLNKVDF